jgi:hypothetical protein
MKQAANLQCTAVLCVALQGSDLLVCQSLTNAGLSPKLSLLLRMRHTENEEGTLLLGDTFCKPEQLEEQYKREEEAYENGEGSVPKHLCGLCWMDDDQSDQLGAAYTSTITALQQQASAGATSAASAVQQAHEQLLAALRHAVNASFGYKRVWVGKSFCSGTEYKTRSGSVLKKEVC